MNRNHEIDRILLGDNPFIGVNHLSQERLRENGIEFDPNRVASVINSALDAGAQGVACSGHPVMKKALKQMREENRSKGFGVYLIVPDAQSYVRIASEKGIIGLLTETFGRLSLRGKAKAVVGGSLFALTSNPTMMMKTYLDAEVSRFAKTLPNNAEVKSLFLHELLTELLVSFEMVDLAEEYIDFVKNTLNIKPGFVTRNFARFADFLLENDLANSDLVVMTPFNRVGFQMNPSRAECERSLTRISNTKIIAMSILAGGYSGLAEAVDYILALPRELSCVVGVSTESQAVETFGYLRRRFGEVR
jgi:hypothetical protein